ncbi:MAG: SOS response-associated peptidase [Gammaproteobacteria bacterium]|nr:SOS response-associated peptidase [Gammaproteobacteria bacterium]MCP5135383.1 SOS response-associated peptidase [Gammaproteobacteria bacterium]
MCGRYNLVTDAQALVDFFDVAMAIDPVFVPRYNIAPTQFVPIVRDQGRGRDLLNARWGLVPHWSREGETKYSTINARAETVAEKPTYRASFRHRRCLVPATGFYEWKAGDNGKQPYQITLAGGGLLAFAGLWDRWIGQEGELFSFSIVVTAADASMQGLHERMPVMLEPKDYSTWLTGSGDVVSSLLRPHGQNLELRPVSRYVNSPAHDDPRCLDPV